MTYQKLQFGAVQELANTYNRIQDLRSQRDELSRLIGQKVAEYKKREVEVIKIMGEDDEDKEGYLTYVDGGCVYTVRDVFNNAAPAKKVGKSKQCCDDEDEYDGPSPMRDPADFERKVIVTRTAARIA